MRCQSEGEEEQQNFILVNCFNYHPGIDHLVVFAFLLITLVVGLRAGKGVRDFRTYAIGHKKFGTAALVLTFLATEVGGHGAINLAGEIGTAGIIILVTFLSFSISYLVQALWIAPKMMHFSSCLTMGDVMRTLYGRPTQVIVGALSFIVAICCAGAEIVMLGVISESLLGVDARWGIIVGGLSLTLYVVNGGMGAVAKADVVQFLMLLVLLVLFPILAATALQQAGGIKEVLTHIPRDQLQLWHHPKFSYYLVLFVSFGVFHANMMDPALIPRMLMAQSHLQLRRMFLTLAGLFAVVFLVFAVLGTTGHRLYPTLAAKEIIPQMIKTLLPVGLRGLMVGGMIAVVMASADSYLHAAGVTLVHDVLQPLGVCRAVFIQELRWVRYVTLLAGLLIMGLGLTKGKNLYALIFAYIEFAAPLLIFPFFAGVLGLKPDQRAFYGSTAVTLLTFLAGKRWLPEAYSYFLTLIGISASGIVFFVLHLVRHRGFIVVRRDAKSAEKVDEYLWQPRSQDFLNYLERSIPTPQRIIRYSQKQVDKYGAPYILFGAFCCINFTLPYFMWEHASRDSYNLMLYLRVWGGLACGLLIVRDKWSDSFLPYLPTFWHLTLLYCLPFTSTVMFLLTKGSAEWLINVAITIMFLIVLVDWLSFVILSALGVLLGSLFYQLVIGPIDLHLDFSTGYLLVYTCVFSTVIALLFSSRKEQHLAAKLREISDHYYSINQVKTDATPAVMRIAAMIDQQIQETIVKYGLPMHAVGNVQREDTSHTVTTDWLHYFFPTALAVIQQGDQMIEQLVAELRTNYIAPQGSLLSLQACVNAALKAYRMRHSQNIHIDLLEDYMIDTSFNHLQYAIIHVLRFLHAHHLGDGIYLRTTRQQGIHMKLPGQALPPALLHDLCTLFPAKEMAKHPGLAISKLLIEAHGGRLLYATGSQPQNAYTEFIIFLPPAEGKPRTDVEIV
jgi:Na+/proline symporter